MRAVARYPDVIVLLVSVPVVLLNFALGNWLLASVHAAVAVGSFFYVCLILRRIRNAAIEAELQAIPRPPKDFHVVVRGVRYSNIDLVYLGPMTDPDGEPCQHWRALRPFDFPDGVDLSEIIIRGEIADSTIIDFWIPEQ